MKKFYIFLSLIIVLFIIFFNCQQTSSSGGGSSGDSTSPIWSSQLKITASDAEDSDYFGKSVSISGDYAIVGATFDDGIGVTNRGAAYIYHRTGVNTWDTGTKIIATDPEDNDYFGYSVSISGDYVIVGTSYEDGLGSERGAAYIYHRTGTNTWDAGTKITASDAEDNDYFGNSVSISGDYAIVGALYEDGLGSDRGAAYIYHRTGTNTWDEETKITASGAEAEDSAYFGSSVSISEDYAIIGALCKDEIGIDRGAAYIYHRTGTNTWDTGTKITASDAENNDRFGYSVSISGDYVIVGTPYEADLGSNEGAAYIYRRIGLNAWDTEIKIKASDTANNDYFGNSVSISENYVIVGAQREDGIGTDRGAAYIYHRTGVNTWDTGTKIIATDPEDSDYFGESVSISGDYVIVGAQREDGIGTDRGAAYIFK